MLSKLKSLLKNLVTRQRHSISNVRISKKGWELLNNKPLAHEVAKALIEYGKEVFIEGKTITVWHKGQSIRVSSATK